jgi:hypothetical protein
MNHSTNLPAGRGQAPCIVDFLAEQLRRNFAPNLDTLLALSPDEPPADVDGLTRQLMTPAEQTRWWDTVGMLSAKHRGYQASPRKREEMKYGNRPADDAPLSDFVRARISHAKALWSRDVECGWTDLQFPDWLRRHVNGKIWITPLWPDDPGWSQALQLLRLACGSPRFAPTGTWRLRPPPHRRTA